MRWAWFATAFSPQAFEVDGRNIVLWHKGEGEMVAQDDACVHRGAPLSDGRVESVGDKTCIRCPYHNWAFDCDGRIADIPSEFVEGRWPKRPVQRTYAVRIEDGQVVLYDSPRVTRVSEAKESDR